MRAMDTASLLHGLTMMLLHYYYATSSRRCYSMATVMGHTPCVPATSKCELHNTMPAGYVERIR
jgi:hypothetical protein